MTQFHLPTHMRVTIGLPTENQRFVAAFSKALANMVAEGAAREMAGEKKVGEFKF